MISVFVHVARSNKKHYLAIVPLCYTHTHIHIHTTKNNKKTWIRWIDNNISNVQHPFHYILYMPNVHVDFYLLLQDFSNLWDCTWKQHCDKAFNQTTLLTLDCYIQKENKTLTRTKQQNKCSMFELPRTQTHSFYYSTR